MESKTKTNAQLYEVTLSMDKTFQVWATSKEMAEQRGLESVNMMPTKITYWAVKDVKALEKYL